MVRGLGKGAKGGSFAAGGDISDISYVHKYKVYYTNSPTMYTYNTVYMTIILHTFN
jgi:hypothetical protein